VNSDDFPYKKLNTLEFQVKNCISNDFMILGMCIKEHLFFNKDFRFGVVKLGKIG